MTGEELWAELEKITSVLANSGFGNLDSGTMGKLEKFAAAAGDLDMKEGKRLIENLSEAIKAIMGGKSTADSGSIRLTALDFYLKNHSASEAVEDL
jgi:hypothetical protein